MVREVLEKPYGKSSCSNAIRRVALSGEAPQSHT
jgi:hypothetical protein